MNKPRGRPPKVDETLKPRIDAYFNNCKPKRPEGEHPSVTGLRLAFGTDLPPYAQARMQAYLEHLLCEGNAEVIHVLRKHFGW